MSLRRKLLRKACCGRLATRALSFLLLVYWLILTWGVPLPLPVKMAKDRSRPFPCMDSMCGCNSAEACWRSCCCHTNAEKLAWAQQRGITPPSYVVAAAKREANRRCARCESHEAARSCCQKHQPEADTTLRACAACKKDSPPVPTAAASSGEEDAPTYYVVFSNMHRCQGSLLKLLVTLPALPPERSSPALVQLPGEWLSLDDQQSLAGYFSPAVPPPRVFG